MTRRIQTLSVPLILCLGMALFVKASDKSPSKKEEDALPVPKISWEKHILTVTAPDLPGGKVDIWYLEAYCRPGSTDRVWNETVIGHETEKLAASPDGTSITLRCTLKDGVTVDHLITSVPGGVEFKLKAHNPTKAASEAHWAQPCMRVGEFTGTAEDPDK